MNLKWKDILSYGLVVVIFVAMGYLFYPFALSMVIGGIFSVVVYPLILKLDGLKWSRWISSFFVVTAFSIIFIGPLVVFLIIGSKVLVNFIQTELVGLGSLRQYSSLEDLQNFLGRLGIKEFAIFDHTIKVVSNFLIEGFQRLVGSLPFIGLSLFIITFTMFFFLIDAENINALIKKYTAFSDSKFRRLSDAFRQSSHVVVVSNILGGLTQSVISMVGALATGTGNIFLIGFSIFLMSFVPVVGTAPITLGLAIKNFIAGEIGLGIGWLIIGAITGVSDGLIKTLIIHETMHVHPYFGLLSVLGGIIAFGIPGLLIGPLIAALFTTCVPLLLDKK